MTSTGLHPTNNRFSGKQCYFYKTYVYFVGSAAEARVSVESGRQARAVQDIAEERCSMPYRAPELFNVEPGTVIDERTDIWVGVPSERNLFGEVLSKLMPTA